MWPDLALLIESMARPRDSSAACHGWAGPCEGDRARTRAPRWRRRNQRLRSEGVRRLRRVHPDPARLGGGLALRTLARATGDATCASDTCIETAERAAERRAGMLAPVEKAEPPTKPAAIIAATIV